uniref:Uncharacterized protein n=1 Tax=Falco tinnunculus TaxID=100819 RepID=A0A8C4URX2_FALTI
MAECDPLESLQKEASCSICLDYFRDPVSINCGHSFCRDCITRCSGKSDRRFTCPQCRGIAQKRKFRPNRELRNLAEIAKKLSSRAGYVAGAGSLCQKHQEPLKLFCQEDRVAICVVCDRSHAHRAHTVAPIEEAAQECKEQIQSKLKSLKDERERLQGLKLTREKRSQKYLQQARAERWKIMLVFKQLHQFQDEQEHLLLMWLEDVEKQIVQTQVENDRKISMEISHLGNLIHELEGMSPQPENKSLQDARSALTRYVALPFQRGQLSPARCHKADTKGGVQEGLSSRLVSPAGSRWPWAGIMSPSPPPFSWRKPISITEHIRSKWVSSTVTLGPLICPAVSQLTQPDAWGEISLPSRFSKQCPYVARSARREYKSLLLPGVKQGFPSN